MLKLRHIKMISLLLFAIWLTGCGSMIVNEPNPPMPKKEEMKKAKQQKTIPEKKPEIKPEVEQTLPVPGEMADPQVVFADIDKLLAEMSLTEKVGQMFLVRCPELKAVEEAQKYQFGGYVLFGIDFKDKSKDQVVAMIAGYQGVAKIPMWIAVDEEGGMVNRVSRNPNLRLTPFASPRMLYENGGFDRIKNDTREKAELLKSLGINLNLAPVCDIPEKKDDFIYERTIGTDPALVEEYVTQVVNTMNEQKMASALKHFPGYGNNIDTHTELAYDQRPLENFKKRDFLPFMAGIKNGASAIMVSHNIIIQVDDKMPASLSPAVHQLLRKDLAFKGVTITDELAMEGVKKLMTDEEIAIQAILAGNDMLCTTAYASQIPAVIEAVESGRIKLEVIDQAVRRILLWKQSFMKI